LLQPERDSRYDGIGVPRNPKLKGRDFGLILGEETTNMHAAVVGMKSLTKEFVSFTFGHKSEVNEGISDHALRTTRLGLEVRDPEHLRWRRTVEPNERGAMFGRTTHDHGGRRDRLVLVGHYFVWHCPSSLVGAKW
jgi:hypothetical protein